MLLPVRLTNFFKRNAKLRYMFDIANLQYMLYWNKCSVFVFLYSNSFVLKIVGVRCYFEEAKGVRKQKSLRTTALTNNYKEFFFSYSTYCPIATVLSFFFCRLVAVHLKRLDKSEHARRCQKLVKCFQQTSV